MGWTLRMAEVQKNTQKSFKKYKGKKREFDGLLPILFWRRKLVGKSHPYRLVGWQGREEMVNLPLQSCLLRPD